MTNRGWKERVRRGFPEEEQSNSRRSDECGFAMPDMADTCRRGRSRKRHAGTATGKVSGVQDGYRDRRQIHSQDPLAIAVA